MRAGFTKQDHAALVEAYKKDWRGEAGCAGMDQEIFFPDRGHGLGRIAKAVCSTCPVREQCLAFALDTQQKFGVWGGKTEAERRKIIRLARKAAKESSQTT